MAADFTTTTEVLKFRDLDMTDVISDVLDDSPVLARMAAKAVPGSTYKYLKKTGNPTTGFRAENDGREYDKVDRTGVTVTLKIYDASVKVDWQVAQSYTQGGSAAFMAEEAAEHLRSAFAGIEKQIFQGTGFGGDANGFSGFPDQTNLNQLADAQVATAGGADVGEGSSVYLIRRGMGDCELLWGSEGELSTADPTIVPAGGTGTTEYPSLYVPMGAWSGLKIGSVFSVFRLANITQTTAGGRLTDADLAALWELVPAGRRNPSAYIMTMTKRSLRQLRDSRTATNPTGAPAPHPEDWEGVEIVVNESQLDTETLLV